MLSQLKSMSRLSKRSSYLLRHGAIREGLKIDNEGCVLLSDFVAHPLIKQLRPSHNDINEMVEKDQKQRFSLVTKNNGQKFIKANQGHSISEINEEGLNEIKDPKLYPTVVHGTNMENLPLIMKNGLSKMNRNHIHFAIGLPGDNKVISGARQSADVFIYADMEKAISDGIRFFISNNNVILTQGIDGVLSPKYFHKIIKKDGTIINFSSIDSINNKYDFLVVLDFEATCEENDKKWINEIIEWPSVLIDCHKMEIIDQIQIYVKPRNKPILTNFCTQLTGITQETINEKGVDIVEAMKKYNAWLSSHSLLPKNDSIKWTFVTCGNWDLQNMLPNQMTMIGQKVGKHFGHWINIKKVFENFYQQKSISMVNMLKVLHLTLEGRHHSGLDDSLNISKIAIKMMKDGFYF